LDNKSLCILTSSNLKAGIGSSPETSYVSDEMYLIEHMHRASFSMCLQ